MKLLWTPWRLDFIRGPKPQECIFCRKASERNDQANFVLTRGRRSFVLLNTYPYTSGHLMIAPYAHSARLGDLDVETTSEMMELAKRSISALQASYNTDSFNVGMNLGVAAGAGIADHLHLHVVPRWQGDSNFLPVLGDTRLIPETLDSTYDRLLQAGIAPDRPEVSGLDAGRA
jgi:ATP adenylyltransferase